MKSKSMNHVLAAIRKCDVILKNGQEQFVGLYYDLKNLDRPIVLFKCDWSFNYYLSKALELMPVQCVEHKLLARALFENTKEGDYIDESYMHAVATVYSNLDKFKNEKLEFDDELYNDVITQLYQLESDVCKRAEKKFFKNKSCETKSFASADEALACIKEAIPRIAEENEFDYKVIHNASKGTYEFYLETFVDDYDYDFDIWIMAMVSMPEKKIYVGNRCLFKNYELSEASETVEYIKMLMKASKEKFRKDVEAFCKEFEINLRLYEIANNSIKTMLEMNYKKTGIEYAFYDSNKTSFMTYLKDLEDSSKMYEICITYNEFIRNPDAFKELIEKPKILQKWNFWSRRKKFKPEYFEILRKKF